MAELGAFRALRYGAGAGRLADLLAPPYDVVGAAERRELASRSPHNLVHLLLPEGEDEGGLLESRYDRARRLLRSWVESGVLEADGRPSMLVVRERFRLHGGERVRTGIEAALTLCRYGEGDVFPHEHTIEGPRADRLRLLRAVRTNLSQVLVLVPDADGALRELMERATGARPDHEIEGPDAASRSVWRIYDEGITSAFAEAAARRPAVIADGHHRYETALAYRDELRARGTGAGEASAVLCHVVPVEDPGLAVLPTHRVVTPRRPVARGSLIEGLGACFEMEPVDRDRLRAFARAAPGEGSPPEFAVAFGRPIEIRLARLRDGDSMARRAPGRAEAWRGLDVAAAHLLVMEDLLGVSEGDLTRGGLVSYTHDGEAALAAAAAEGGVAIVLRPTPPGAVVRVACAGERMPQKSTYFYPKVAAGVALRPLVAPAEI